MDEQLNEAIEVLGSELSYIGEKLTEISKCLKKMSNWSDADEKKYCECEECDEDEE